MDQQAVWDAEQQSEFLALLKQLGARARQCRANAVQAKEAYKAARKARIKADQERDVGVEYERDVGRLRALFDAADAAGVRVIEARGQYNLARERQDKARAELLAAARVQFEKLPLLDWASAQSSKPSREKPFSGEISDDAPGGPMAEATASVFLDGETHAVLPATSGWRACSISDLELPRRLEKQLIAQGLRSLNGPGTLGELADHLSSLSLSAADRARIADALKQASADDPSSGEETPAGRVVLAATPTTHLVDLLPPGEPLRVGSVVLSAAGLRTVDDLLCRARAYRGIGYAPPPLRQRPYCVLRNLSGMPEEAVNAIGDAIMDAGLLDGPGTLRDPSLLPPPICAATSPDGVGCVLEPGHEGDHDWGNLSVPCPIICGAKSPQGCTCHLSPGHATPHEWEERPAKKRRKAKEMK